MSKFFKHLNETYITETFSGIVVVGDVHGNFADWQKVVSYSETNNLFIISLGDLVDYGPNSKEIINSAYTLINNNRMIACIGNHEKKLARYFVQARTGVITLKIRHALQASIDSFVDDTTAIQRFESIYDTMPHVMKFKNTYFAHAAIHHTVFEKHEYTPEGFQFSLFGEVDPTNKFKEDGYPNRTYNWINNIPSNINIFLGHDIRGADPVIVEVNNSKIVWLDTGSGKNGSLSGAVVNFNDNEHEFVNFSNM